MVDTLKYWPFLTSFSFNYSCLKIKFANDWIKTRNSGVGGNRFTNWVNSIAKVCTTIGMMYQLVLSLQTTITSHHQNSKWGKLFQWISKRIVVIIVVVGSLSHSLAPNWMRSRSLMYDMSWMRGQAIVLFALNFIFMLHLLYNGPMECPLPFCRDEILRAKVSSRRTKDLGAPFQFVNRFIIYGVIKSVFKE